MKNNSRWKEDKITFEKLKERRANRMARREEVEKKATSEGKSICLIKDPLRNLMRAFESQK